MSRLKVTYRRNLAYSEEYPDRPKLFATLDLSGYGVDERISDLPVYFRPLTRPVGPILQVYSTSVAGLPLERGNLTSLEKTLDLYLGALVHFGRLPEYLFQVGDNAWPIYRLPDQLVTRCPGSPVVGAPTIGELRHALVDYFKVSGQIGNRKELNVLLLSRSDLQLYAPVCVLRAPGTADIPVFPLDDARLTAPVNATSITVPLDGGKGILALHQETGAYLAQQGKLDDPTALSARKLPAAAWTRVKAGLRPSKRALSYYVNSGGRPSRHSIPIFENGRLLIAARTNRLGRTALSLAADIWRLKEKLGQELYAEGKLPSPNNLCQL